jgi:hypothetical protein
MARMTERRMIPAVLQRRANVDAKTLRSLMNGDRWPTSAVRGRIESALSWPTGEIERRAQNEIAVNDLARFSELELLAELLRRAGVRERAGNLVGVGAESSTKASGAR